jgi:hypothetical protein
LHAVLVDFGPLPKPRLRICQRSRRASRPPSRPRSLRLARSRARTPAPHRPTSVSSNRIAIPSRVPMNTSPCPSVADGTASLGLHAHGMIPPARVA